MKPAAKTNALRILDSLMIPYRTAAYPVSEEHADAGQVARELGVSAEIVFKTLVARDDRQEILVFCIPGSSELELKKAAMAAGAKKVDLIALKDLLPLTGYVRGGCSPVGMKKRFPVWVDEMAAAYERIYLNAGARGLQMILAPADLLRAIDGRYADLV
jgi:Cys-tRNA(Pro)/Cys-tRNA(Cys) deacylase